MPRRAPSRSRVAAHAGFLSARRASVRSALSFFFHHPLQKVGLCRDSMQSILFSGTWLQVGAPPSDSSIPRDSSAPHASSHLPERSPPRAIASDRYWLHRERGLTGPRIMWTFSHTETTREVTGTRTSRASFDGWKRCYSHGSGRLFVCSLLRVGSRRIWKLLPARGLSGLPEQPHDTRQVSGVSPAWKTDHSAPWTGSPCASPLSSLALRPGRCLPGPGVTGTSQWLDAVTRRCLHGPASCFFLCSHHLVASLLALENVCCDNSRVPCDEKAQGEKGERVVGGPSPGRKDAAPGSFHQLHRPVRSAPKSVPASAGALCS